LSDILRNVTYKAKSLALSKCLSFQRPQLYIIHLIILIFTYQNVTLNAEVVEESCLSTSSSKDVQVNLFSTIKIPNLQYHNKILQQKFPNQIWNHWCTANKMLCWAIQELPITYTYDFMLLDWPPKRKTVCKKFYFWMSLIESVAITETNFYSRPNEFVSIN
jgi:hypothetical protein